MLSCLERKIPPPIVALAAAGLMWLLAEKFGLPRYRASYQSIICGLLVAFGLLVDFAAVWLFWRVGTTVNPMSPHKASNLVTSGIYRYTRNPMYVGNLIFLMAWLVWLGAPYGLIGLIAYVIYTVQYQIKPEERALSALFGDEYGFFCSSVRRWF
ncbi:MAG: protein-S-isoprenylcysteine methyltransferase [Piscirickettsiaceae bacterium]|nr:MAG: protein-S-isoprenylcysteine methyltransferase [Piscirickettsiaceae bacterium]